ncbi:MAG: YdcF family protein, partial [Cyanobacteria bacterium P01_F01_bin.4]
MQWFAIRAGLTALLNNPGLMVIMLGVLCFSLWQVIQRKYRWRGRRMVRWVSLLPLLLYFSLLLPVGQALAEKGLTVWLPMDKGQTADAIVILGRGSDLQKSRIQEATQLWEAGRAPQIFVSGRGDAPQISRRLKARGVKATALASEDCSRTTEENAEFTAKLLNPQVRTIILVTDPPHMLRSLLTFRSFGFRVIPHLSDVAHQPTDRNFAIRVVREYAGLIAYGIKGRYFPRETATEGPTPAESLS